MTTSAEASARGTELFQTDFPAEEFVERRRRIAEAVGTEAHAVLQGAPPLSGFGFFRQTSQFYFCCGIEAPQAYLLVAGADASARLYLPHRPEGHVGEGDELAAEDGDVLRRVAGIDETFGPESLAEHLADVKVLYTPFAAAETWMATRWTSGHANKLVAADRWDGRPPRRLHFLSLLRTRFPGTELRDLTPILDGMRAVKSPREVDLMRRAGHLTALAITEAMRATRPGVIEYQLGAIANYIYRLHGARGEGYRPIIASGANAWYGHYYRNDCVMQDGDLVLMDVAPDLGGYTSDIGRMWPVNGTYAPWQRELYGFIVTYHKALLARIGPGRTADEIHADAAAEMAEVVEATAWSKPVFEQAARKALEFKGHLSHAVGMAVHDSGRYRDQPLRPGVVFSVDPQIRVPEEKLYVRCEDTVAVTEDGVENLTGAAPLELDHVEATMREESRFPLWPGRTGDAAAGGA